MYTPRPDLVMLGYGSREFDDGPLIRRVLLHFRPAYLIHGDCETGADHWLDLHARDLGIQRIKLPAPWRNGHGGKAGPMRNSLMARLAPSITRELEGVLIGCGFMLDEGLTAGTRDMKAKCSNLHMRGEMESHRCYAARDWFIELEEHAMLSEVLDAYQS